MSFFDIFRSKPATLRSGEFRLSVTFLVEPDEGRFHAFSPALPGLHADGQTEQEAAASFVAEVPPYIASILRHGDPLPIGVIVEAQHQAARRHSEEILVPCVPPSLLTSGASSRA